MSSSSIGNVCEAHCIVLSDFLRYSNFNHDHTKLNDRKSCDEIIACLT